MEDGWEALIRGSGWTTDKQAHGVSGYVRITEVVHSPATGWHVHFHVILLLDRELAQLAMDGLRASLATRFARGVARRGGHASVDGQDLQPMTAGTEGALANYHFNGTTMRWSRDGSRTPIAILSELESTGEGLDLWDELTTTVSAKRRTKCVPPQTSTRFAFSALLLLLISREITQLIPGQGRAKSLWSSNSPPGLTRCQTTMGRGPGATAHPVAEVLHRLQDACRSPPDTRGRTRMCPWSLISSRTTRYRPSRSSTRTTSARSTTPISTSCP